MDERFFPWKFLFLKQALNKENIGNFEFSRIEKLRNQVEVSTSGASTEQMV